MTETRVPYRVGLNWMHTDILCPDCGAIAYTRHVETSGLHEIRHVWMTMPGSLRPITRCAWLCECGREWWFDASAERVAVRRERLERLADGVLLEEQG